MKKLLLISCLIFHTVDASAESRCDSNASRPLDGRCNNLYFPALGAEDTPLLYLAGQHYARGENEVLYFMREEARQPGEPNPYPYVPTADAPAGTCGPPGHSPECEFTIVTNRIEGFGAKSKYNARVLSNALHDIESPLAPPGAEPELNQAGLTTLWIRFSQIVAHDLQLLEPTVTPRRRRHGFANQSDPSNPTVLSGVPVLEPFDLFNVSPVYTPRGVPEGPLSRAIIVTSPEPTLVERWNKPRLRFANAATAYLDGDTFYGRSSEFLDRLRAHQGGKLSLTGLTSPRVGPIPPLTIAGFPPSFADTGLRDAASLDGQEAFTPSYADERNLSTVGTATVHVLWLRFHNLQAELCRDRHPEADPMSAQGDEILFECARRWTVAVYQHVVFDDFIPAMTGRSLPRYRGYKPLVHPQGSIETILGPLSLHSTPGELSPIARPDGTVDERLQVELPGQPNPPPGYFPFIGSLFPTPTASAAFYLALSGIPTPMGDPSDPDVPWVLAEDPVAQQVRGMAYFAHEANDLAVIDSQRNIPANYGFDLVASSAFRNQQLGAANYYQARWRFVRGRERRIYGRRGCPYRLLHRDDVSDPVACFELVTRDRDRARLIEDQLDNSLLGVKAKVKHIPLLSGVLMEPRQPNSILGQTGLAMVENQFRRSRDGDRYYYRNRLTEDEIAEVESYSMAEVIRAVLGPDVGVQDDVFRVPPAGFFGK